MCWPTRLQSRTESFVLGAMLRHQARLQPDKVFARFEDGTCWTYAQTLDEARRGPRWTRAHLVFVQLLVHYSYD